MRRQGPRCVPLASPHCSFVIPLLVLYANNGSEAIDGIKGRAAERRERAVTNHLIHPRAPHPHYLPIPQPTLPPSSPVTLFLGSLTIANQATPSLNLRLSCQLCFSLTASSFSKGISLLFSGAAAAPCADHPVAVAGAAVQLRSTGTASSGNPLWRRSHPGPSSLSGSESAYGFHRLHPHHHGHAHHPHHVHHHHLHHPHHGLHARIYPASYHYLSTLATSAQPPPPPPPQPSHPPAPPSYVWDPPPPYSQPHTAAATTTTTTQSASATSASPTAATPSSPSSSGAIASNTQTTGKPHLT